MVLVVDDNRWARQLLCEALESQGYGTEQASDLADVRQIRRRTGPAWRPDVTLVELVRERGNGYTVAAWLQSQGLGIVVLLSERNDAVDRLWARSRGVLHMTSRVGGIHPLCLRIGALLADSHGSSASAQEHNDSAGSAT